MLYVEKSKVAGVHFFFPNLSILGQDAQVSIRKHTDDLWVTDVTAFDGRYEYRVALERRLDGEERDEFVAFAIDLIENDLSMPRAAR